MNAYIGAETEGAQGTHPKLSLRLTKFSYFRDASQSVRPLSLEHELAPLPVRCSVQHCGVRNTLLVRNVSNMHLNRPLRHEPRTYRLEYATSICRERSR
jgi:hypothetical protein